MINPRTYFLITLIIILTLTSTAGFFLGGSIEEIFVTVDCNEINERPEDFKPLEGTIEEKFTVCNNWNEIAEDNKNLPLVVKLVLILPVFFYIYSIHTTIGLKEIFKKNYDDEPTHGTMPKGWGK